MDFDKVFTAFRNCISEPKCRDCPWEQCEQFNQKKVSIPVTLALDVLNLLKEQEAKTVESIQMDRSDKWGADLTGYCPSCKRPLKSRFNQRFCGECGQAVKWE